MGIGAGALISISTFLQPISADFGWLRGEISFAYMAGAIAMGLGGIAMGLALGLALAGRALGQGLVPFAAGFLIAAYGWRNAYTILGIVCVAGMLPLTLIIRNPPGLREAKEASRRASAAEQQAAYPVPPKISVAWLSGAALFCCTCMGTAMVHTVAIAEDAGIGAKEAAGVILLIYVSGFFGRVAFGKLSDHIGGIRSYLLASFGQTVLIYWFTQMHSIAGFYIHAVIFGFFMSGVMTGLVVCVRELTPVHVRGTSTGIVFLVAWTGMGLGGYQAGFFFDWSGAYNISYATAAAMGLVNVVIVGALYFFVRQKTVLQINRV